MKYYSSFPLCRVYECDARERAERERAEEEARNRPIPPPPPLTGLPPPLEYDDENKEYDFMFDDYESVVIDTGMATVKVSPLTAHAGSSYSHSSASCRLVWQEKTLPVLCSHLS